MSANYTLTGNFQQLTGVSDATGQLVLQLCNYGNQTPRAAGVLLTTGPITVTCVAGAFTVTFWGNDQITPSGTFYTVRILTSKGQLVSDTSYQFQGGGSNDLSTLTPIASIPPVPVTTYAPINSPAFTGIPTAPTAGLGNNTTQLATTAFVLANSSTGPATVVAVPTAGGASPVPAYTADLEVPSNINPSIYVQDGAGNWHPQAGIDTTTADAAGSGPSVPPGILTWDRIQYYRDTLSDTQPGKNAFMSIAHQAGAGTSWNNQDRSMWITMTNVTAAVTNFSIAGNVVTIVVNNLVNGILGVGKIGFRKGQRIQAAGLSTGTYLNAVPLTVLTASAITGSSTTATQTITASDAGFTHANVGSTADAGTLNQLLYGMENLQMEQDVVGTPVTVAAVDGEYSTLSVQMSDKHKGNSLAAPNLGCNAIRAHYFREQNSGTWGSVQPSAGRFQVQDNATTGDAFSFVNGLTVLGTNAGSCPDLYVGVNLPAPSTRFLGGNWGLSIGNFGSNASDYAINVAGGQTFLGGIVGLPSMYGTTGTILVSAPIEAASFKSDALTGATIGVSNFSVLGTPGATSITYVLVYRDANGNGVSSNAYTVTTANATLSSSNSVFFNTLGAPLGVAAIELWRTVGGPSQGKIATLSLAGLITSGGISASSVNDIGLAAIAGTLPVGNATGSIAAAGPVSAGSYTVANLPPGVAGQMAFATNGRKAGEGAGSGTGVPVYFSNAQWRVFSTDATVAS